MTKYNKYFNKLKTKYYNNKNCGQLQKYSIIFQIKELIFDIKNYD